MFLVDKDGFLATPPLIVRQVRPDGTSVERRLCLPGVTRAVVIEAANHCGIIVHERAVTIDDALAAREIFVANAMMGLIPVVRLERHEVGEGKMGEMTRRLLDEYRAKLEAECA